MIKIFSNYKIAINFYKFLGFISVRTKRRFCSFCNKETKFSPYGLKLRRGAMCMQCESLDRHRSLRKIIIEHNLLKNKKNLLFFSPDLSLFNFFKEKIDIQTCDFGGGKHVDLNLDITDIKLNDKTYDVVVAIHILEHIENDSAALSEVKRILKDSGIFIVMIPQSIRNKKTEEKHISNPITRIKKYGQHDHVRLYGLDFTEKARSHGFKVKVFAKRYIGKRMYYDNFIKTKDNNSIVYVLKKPKHS